MHADSVCQYTHMQDNLQQLQDKIKILELKLGGVGKDIKQKPSELQSEGNTQ